MKYYSNHSLKSYNTFALNVTASHFYVIEEDHELYELHDKGVFNGEHLILGGGSNVLFTKNVECPVLHMKTIGIRKISEDETKVILDVKAGVEWNELVHYAVENNFYGIENLTDIPGTCGAAPIQNIGAYGVEIKDVLIDVQYFDIASKTIKVINSGDCNFGYRDSIFKNELKGKYIITGITIELKKTKKLITNYRAIKDFLGNKKEEDLTLHELSELISKIRSSKLPDPKRFGNAGSFFKNPEISKKQLEKLKENHSDLVFFEVENSKYKIPAAYMIEKCGFKGKNVGNVGTYNRQALVIINLGRATGNEILDYAKKIQDAVYQKFNVKIHPEVNII
jgi:UDP-N-acetylmuramate dehydrogenase